MNDVQRALDFSGPDLQAHDHVRLGEQLAKILAFMAPGQWVTLAEIHAATGAPEASASAQLRHARRPRFGAHIVEKRRRGGETSGLYEYRVQAREGF